MGCYPCDKLPHKIIKYPAALVANNDPSSKEGSHWIGLFVEDDKTVYYFDSLGRDPNTCIRRFLEKFKKIFLNKPRFQSVFSENCGYYCIYFIYCMSNSNANYELTFNKLSKNLLNYDNSDSFVYHFVKRMVK